MAEQNIRNHVRYVPLYHFVTLGAILAMLGGSIVHLMHATADNRYSAALLLLASLIMLSLFYFTRSFALRAHDKAIRAEERFRYYMVKGKKMDERLRMSQIVALRFASDEELEHLANGAVEEQLSSSEIKKAIRRWRADYYRV